MDGNKILFFAYVFLALVYLAVQVLIYLCIGWELECYDWPYLTSIHFSFFAEPLWLALYFIVLLSGLFFLRQKRLKIYLGFLALVAMGFVGLSTPLPW